MTDDAELPGKPVPAPAGPAPPEAPDEGTAPEGPDGAEASSAPPGTDRPGRRGRLSFRRATHTSRAPAEGPEPNEVDPGRRSLRERWERTSAQALGNTPLIVGLGILGVYALIGLLGSFLLGVAPDQASVDSGVLLYCDPASGPTLHLVPFAWGAYPLGETPHIGLNVAQALILGTRWDLLLLAGVVGAAALVGTFLGATAGLLGGWTEALLSPIFDGVLAFPPFMLVAVVLVTAIPHVGEDFRTDAFVVTLVALLWAPFAQGVRAQARLLSVRPFVEAARAAGAGKLRIILRHIVPNCWAPVLAQVPPTIFSILFVLGSFQYLGLVVKGAPLCGSRLATAEGLFLLLPSANFPEWTWVLANGILGWSPDAATDQWWGILFPSLWILLFLLGVVLVCDGLLTYSSPAHRR